MKKNLIMTTINGGPSEELLVTFERYLNNTPLDKNEAFHFHDIPLRTFALESAVISEHTALHKCLKELAYYQFFLYLYDDIDWVDEYADFVEYAKEMFTLMGVTIPEVFLLADSSDAAESRHQYSGLFVNGLNVFVHSAFAMAWERKDLLYRFNLRLAGEVSVLRKQDFPQLESDGRLKRANYYPKWLVDRVSFRARGFCHYCGCPVKSPLTPTPESHMDHMISIATGGTNDATNFVLACVSCNTRKGAKEQRMPDVFHWPKIGVINS